MCKIKDVYSSIIQILGKMYIHYVQKRKCVVVNHPNKNIKSIGPNFLTGAWLSERPSGKAC
jgi:uncharacterized membrane protein